MSSYHRAVYCRACKALLPETTVFDLGDVPVVEFPDNPKGRGLVAPLNLVECPDCELVQLQDSVNADLLFRDFSYRSGVTQSMKEALKDVVESATKYVDLKPGDVVIDIGANDGTLLSFFPKNVVRVGCDPSENMREKLEQQADIAITDYWSYEAYEKAFQKYQRNGKK